MSAQTEGYKYNFVNGGGYSWKKPTPLNEETEEITLKPPNSDLYWNRSSSKINPLIFAKSLERAPNIRKLNIVKLSGAEALLLKPIINLFKKHYPKNLVSITVHTPYLGLGDDYLKAEFDQLYKNLMENLASSQLTVLTINDETISSSSLNSEILSNFLSKSSNLKTIEVHIEEKVKKLTIPFNLCANLEKISLNKCCGLTTETFDSLKECKKLHTLVLENLYNSSKLTKLLIKPHDLDLCVLDCGSTTMITSDYELYMITKQLPNLEVFKQESFGPRGGVVTDDGLALLGHLCPKLTTFSFYLDRITDDGFANFVRNTNNLQKLSVNHANHLGEKSLIELAKNCPKLKSLELTYWKEITEPGLIALAKHCPQLEHIEIKLCKNISFEGIEKFIENAPQLKAIKVWTLDSSKEFNRLSEKYPHLDWSPKFKYADTITIDLPLSIKSKKMPTFSQKLLDRFLLESIRHERNEDTIQFLKLGANPNMARVVESMLFSYEYTEYPLVLAALKGNLKIVNLLIESGAEVTVAEKYLGGLSQPKHFESLMHLLACGIDPNTVGPFNATPLQLMAAKAAIGNGLLFDHYPSVDIRCLKHLVLFGAYIEVLHNNRLSLSDLAKKFNNPEAYKYFTEELKIPELQLLKEEADSN